MLEEDNAENELGSVFKAYLNPIDQYIHLPARVSEGACCDNSNNKQFLRIFKWLSGRSSVKINYYKI